MLLPLRQHLQRAPQAQNGILSAVLFLRSVAAPKAAESPARHGVGYGYVLDGEESHSRLMLLSLGYRLLRLLTSSILCCLSWWKAIVPRAGGLGLSLIGWLLGLFARSLCRGVLLSLRQ